MLDFFIALFGGMFLLGKYTNEKIQDKNATIRNNNYITRTNYIKTLYNANYDLEKEIKEYIFCGKHFEDICNSLATDLQYVFGSEWKSKLNIPNGYRVNYSALYPSMHEYWIYHLLLAKKGKIDNWITYDGYGIGYDINNAKTNVKFAECIEGRLLNAGCNDLKLALELDLLCPPNRYRQPNQLCGGKIKIQSLCLYPTHRLWADYVKKA